MRKRTKCTPTQRAAEYLKRVAALTGAEQVRGDSYWLRAGRRNFLETRPETRVSVQGSSQELMVCRAAGPCATPKLVAPSRRIGRKSSKPRQEGPLGAALPYLLGPRLRCSELAVDSVPPPSSGSPLLPPSPLVSAVCFSRSTDLYHSLIPPAAQSDVPPPPARASSAAPSRSGYGRGPVAAVVLRLGCYYSAALGRGLIAIAG